MHKWFAATDCPGAYLESKFPYIASEVNKKLTRTETTQKPPQCGEYSVGQVVAFLGGKHHTSANSDKGYSIRASKAKVTAICPGGKHPIHLRAIDAKGNYTSGVYGWVDLSTIKR